MLRGRELQAALEKCVDAANHYMQEIETLEATIDIDNQIIEITRPKMQLPQLPKIQQIWKQLVARFNTFTAGVVAATVVYILIRIL